jgi:Tol biopolymer transport system component
MAIKSGKRIGAYEVRSTLGEGAMGQVFLAHDTRLQRDVALKVLPEHFAADPDRLARFQREAQLLASLNHPNIAHIYGLEQTGESVCIVMELIAGETLGERIQRGPVPLDESIEIGKQIAEALEAAHERGVVHRDLKPANIKVTPEGKVKVLDFGLAKALAGENNTVDVSNAPTMLGSMAGAIIGTPGYMAPEQARGRQVDKRADIWAFGCVLYEMLTGVRAFDGEDVAEALGAIIHKEPSWERVPAKMLPVLRRCLEKDPKRRLRDIGDAMPLIDQAPASAVAAAPTPRAMQWLTWGAVGVALILAVILVASYFRAAPPAPDVVRFLVPPPPNTGFDIYLGLSPGGRRMAFTAVGVDGVPHLWVRDLDKVESRMLAGTEGAGSPFWSSDSRFIAFSVGPNIKKIDPNGGPPQALSTSDSTIGMGAWSSEDVVVFGHRAAGPLQKVSAAGGVPTAVTALNKARGDIAHSFPSFLPDGRHFIYFVATGKAETTGAYVGSLDDKPEEQSATLLLANASGAVFVPSSDRASGQILYVRAGNLMAQPFDVSGRTLRGEPTPIAERVDTVNGVYGAFSASTNGVLAYRTVKQPVFLPVWVDRTGREIAPAINSPLERAQYPALSPDGKRLALVVSGALWVYDLGGRPPIKLTFAGAPASPIWTRDGRRIIFEPNTPEWERVLVSIPSDGSMSKPEPVSPTGHLHPLSWTPDGKELMVSRLTPVGTGNNGDVVKFALSVDAKTESILETPAQDGVLGATVSPDGRWLAYTSDTTGNTEVWVKPFGREGAPVRVSPSGGLEPLWSRDGRELFYRDGANKVMTIAVDTRTGFDFKPAVMLFQGTFLRSSQAPSYALASDGRFLMLRPVDTAPNPIAVVLNWISKK